MNKAINVRMMVIAVITIIFTTLLCTLCYYGVFREEVLEDLEVYTRLLSGMENLEEYSDQLLDADIRMTIIDQNGEPVFDNEADIAGMGNQSERAEIKEAYEKGEGHSERVSETLKHSNFYYAIKLDNGMVVRTAKETSSIYSIFGHAFPYVAMVAIVLLIICFVISSLLTKSIVQPFEAMARDMLDESKTAPADRRFYKELRPVIEHIQNQHADIIKNSHIRQEFTANVSHELKTPLAAISGYSELIESGMTNEVDTRKFAGEIHRNSERLLTLINDILRLSELDVSDRDSILTEEVDIYDIALSCQAMLDTVAAKQGVNVEVGGSSCKILADRSMMEELIYNLVDNAIRYNKEGGTVWITAEKGTLRVKDNGIGIPKEYQERIFERFFRVDKSRSKKTGGTGLGLAIVKHIVELHGATLSMESSEKTGTDIMIRFL